MDINSKTIIAKVDLLSRDHKRMVSYYPVLSFEQENKVLDRMEKTVQFIEAKVGPFQTHIDESQNVTISLLENA